MLRQCKRGHSTNSKLGIHFHYFVVTELQWSSIVWKNNVNVENKSKHSFSKSMAWTKQHFPLSNNLSRKDILLQINCPPEYKCVCVCCQTGEQAARVQKWGGTHGWQPCHGAKVRGQVPSCGSLSASVSACSRLNFKMTSVSICLVDTCSDYFTRGSDIFSPFSTRGV